jgi:hypothetical protein
MDFHYAEKRALLDKPWDVVVMHGYSTWTKHIRRSSASDFIRQADDRHVPRQKRQARIWLDATWSRADQTYPEGKPWHGKPIQQMGNDIAVAYDAAAKNARAPAWCRWAWPGTGDGYGVADDNPYDRHRARQDQSVVLGQLSRQRLSAIIWKR